MAKAFADLARSTVRTTDGKSESRTKMIQAVRAACHRLGLDDDARRETQLALTGKTSMTEMSIAELGIVLDRLNKDWKGPSAHRAHVGKVRALWWSLYWLGAVDEPNDAAIGAFVRRQTGVSALRFLDHKAAPAVIEALKAWAAREGVVWEVKPGDLGDRRAVAAALTIRLGPLVADALLAKAGLMGPRSIWTRHEWDAAIRLLGKQARRGTSR